MEKKMNKERIITFRDETFKVADDLDLGYGLEIIEIKEKAFNENIKKAKYLADVLPMMIKMIIPEAEQMFLFNYEEKKFLFNDQRLGMCELENLLRDLTNAEAEITKEKLPHLFAKTTEDVDQNKEENKEPEIKNG